MRLRNLLIAILVASCVLTEITCITNREFLNLFKDSESADDLGEDAIDDFDVGSEDKDDRNGLPVDSVEDIDAELEALSENQDKNDPDSSDDIDESDSDVPEDEDEQSEFDERLEDEDGESDSGVPEDEDELTELDESLEDPELSDVENLTDDDDNEDEDVDMAVPEQFNDEHSILEPGISQTVIQKPVKRLGWFRIIHRVIRHAVRHTTRVIRHVRRFHRIIRHVRRFRRVIRHVRRYRRVRRHIRRYRRFRRHIRRYRRVRRYIRRYRRTRRNSRRRPSRRRYCRRRPSRRRYSRRRYSRRRSSRRRSRRRSSHIARHYDYRLEQDECICRDKTCRCIFDNDYRLMGKTFTGVVQLNIGHMKGRHGLNATMTANGRPVFSREIPLRQSAPTCVAFGKFVSGCIEVHKVNFEDKKACIRFSAVMNKKNQRLRFPLDIGCLKLSDVMDVISGQDTTNTADEVDVGKSQGFVPTREVSLDDFVLHYMELQGDQENESDSRGEIQDLF